jgi:hypothetical protein
MRRTPLLAACLLAAGCGGAPTTAPGETGLLRGACEEHHLSGVEGAESGPPTGCRGVTVSVHDTGGRLVATAITDANGQFEVRLKPGRYRVSAGGKFNGGAPRDVEIAPGGVARAEFASSVAFPSPAGGGAQRTAAPARRRPEGRTPAAPVTPATFSGPAYSDRGPRPAWR